MLPLVESALSGSNLTPESTVRLVRACLPVKGAAVQAVMARHLDHPDDEVRADICRCWGACGFRATGTARRRWTRHCVARRLPAIASSRHSRIGRDDTVAPFSGRWQDELAQTPAAHLLAALVGNESRPILRRARFEQGSRGAHALALEMLDDVGGEHRGCSFH